MAQITMKFNLFEGYDGGEDKWRLDTNKARFTASGSLSEAHVIKSFKNGEFSDSGYQTADGRPVYTLAPKAKGASKEFTADDSLTVSARSNSYYKVKKINLKALVADEAEGTDDDE